jgi:hypothetical protein
MASTKFGALTQLRAPKREADEEDQAPAASLPPATQSDVSFHTPLSATPRGPGRPPGKRSNAEWDYANILLRKHTKKMANRKLEDEGTDKDLSELVERLLGMYLRGEIS